jgi:tetratricopeptide (TPR) repeat protein
MVESEASSSSRLERLERIYEENPGTRLFLALAEEYFRGGQLEKAVEVCRGGLDIFPGYTSARVTLARSLIDLRQDPEAEKELGAVIANSPDNLLATRLLAGLLIRMGRTDEARLEVDRLLLLSPDDEEGLRLRDQLQHPAENQVAPATAPRVAGPPPAAVPAVSSAAPLKTSTLARLYEEQGLFEKALGVYDTLLAMDPDNREMTRRADELRVRLAEGEDSQLEDAAATDSTRKKIEMLGRLLDAARAFSRNSAESS